MLTYRIDAKLKQAPETTTRLLRVPASIRRRALLQICAAGPDWVDGPSQRGRRWCGWHDAGQRVQGPAVHGRGDPVGRALVSDVPDQLPRSRTDAAGPRGHGGPPHDHLPLDPGLCPEAGE